MVDATGGTKEPLRAAFDHRLRLEFHGARTGRPGRRSGSRLPSVPEGHAGQTTLANRWLGRDVRLGRLFRPRGSPRLAGTGQAGLKHPYGDQHRPGVEGDAQGEDDAADGDLPQHLGAQPAAGPALVSARQATSRA
jgi:hypothetical protein